MNEKIKKYQSTLYLVDTYGTRAYAYSLAMSVVFGEATLTRPWPEKQDCLLVSVFWKSLLEVILLFFYF